MNVLRIWWNILTGIFKEEVWDGMRKAINEKQVIVGCSAPVEAEKALDSDELI